MSNLDYSEKQLRQAQTRQLQELRDRSASLHPDRRGGTGNEQVKDLETILHQVCQHLIDVGRLTPSDLEYAKRIQGSEGGMLDAILVGTGILSEEVIQSSLAEHLGCAFWHRTELKEEIDKGQFSPKLVSEAFMRQHLFVPLSFDPARGFLRIVVSTPHSDAFSQRLQVMTGATEICFDFATRSSIAEAIYQFFHISRSNPSSLPTPVILQKMDSAPTSPYACPNCGETCMPDFLACEHCGHLLREGLRQDILEPGDTVGPFQVDHPLGRGGMSEVYKATDLRSGKVAALKILQQRLVKDRNAIRRFQREARALRQLSHPGIVGLFEYGFQDGVGLYIATEFIQGREFLELVQQEAPLPLSRLVPIAGQICDALEYAHQHEVIHRDLKPDNILLTVDPSTGYEQAILIDFGLAKVFDDSRALTQTGLALGTPRYMSPEQVSAQELDHRTDIYSFAVILFEALTGRGLFHAQGGYQMMMRHLYASPPDLDKARPEIDYPKSLIKLLQQSLSKHPDYRPRTIGEFKTRLFSCLNPVSDPWLYQVPEFASADDLIPTDRYKEQGPLSAEFDQHIYDSSPEYNQTQRQREITSPVRPIPSEIRANIHNTIPSSSQHSLAASNAERLASMKKLKQTMGVPILAPVIPDSLLSQETINPPAGATLEEAPRIPMGVDLRTSLKPESNEDFDLAKEWSAALTPSDEWNNPSSTFDGVPAADIQKQVETSSLINEEDFDWQAPRPNVPVSPSPQNETATPLATAQDEHTLEPGASFMSQSAHHQVPTGDHQNFLTPSQDEDEFSAHTLTPMPAFSSISQDRTPDTIGHLVPVTSDDIPQVGFSPSSFDDLDDAASNSESTGMRKKYQSVLFNDLSNTNGLSAPSLGTVTPLELTEVVESEEDKGTQAEFSSDSHMAAMPKLSEKSLDDLMAQYAHFDDEDDASAKLSPPRTPTNPSSDNQFSYSYSRTSLDAADTAQPPANTTSPPQGTHRHSAPDIPSTETPTQPSAPAASSPSLEVQSPPSPKPHPFSRESDDSMDSVLGTLDSQDSYDSVLGQSTSSNRHTSQPVQRKSSPIQAPRPSHVQSPPQSRQHRSTRPIKKKVKKPRGKVVSSFSEYMSLFFRFAWYLILLGIAGYLVWFFYFDDNEPDFAPRRRVSRDIDDGSTTPAPPKRRLRVRAKRRKKRPKNAYVPPRECSGKWEAQYKLVWKWDEKAKAFKQKRRWVKVCIPRKKR